ncbi:TVP38/TMEM64 family protein [Falsibacillus pallidus]|uniref:TVP38/TMEM64 family protein n=1 Tax=Falsibacillus pallidus TaxID=493781 RepID=UPI003D99C6D9
MELQALREMITIDTVMEWIQHYKAFGPAVGILLPVIEAVIPFLPLFLLVMANASAFGLWWGFLFSWIGAVAGSMLVFFLFRYFGKKKLFHFFERHKHVKRMMEWVDRHGFGPLFLLLCFPFTPSALVNIVAGLSHISPGKYFFVSAASKMVMIFMISFIGHDPAALVQEPKKTLFILLFIFVMWIAGKQIENKLSIKTQKVRVRE